MSKKSKFKSKYGVMGWCTVRERYVPIAWTLNNAVRCDGCTYFIPNMKTILKKGQ